MLVGDELKIIFKKDKAYLSMQKALSFPQLDLPIFAKSFNAPAYWNLKILKYQKSEGKIYFEITSYNVGETAFSTVQNSWSNALSELKKIAFKSIDTNGLLRTLRANTPVTILPEKSTPLNKIDFSTNEVSFVKQQSLEEIIAPKQHTLNIHETFHIYIKDLRFKLGCVCFEKKFKGHHEIIELNIANYHIREEFDAIKNYFEKVLKSKRIKVYVKINITDNVVDVVEIKSPEIDKINPELIDNVKFEFVKTTKKKVVTTVDKSVFTMDEYFNAFSDDGFESSAFYKTGRELFEDLLQISSSKHYNHLRYLSSKHAHNVMKLRFVHKPFSFIFLIAGDRNYHLIWETLDTEEATYVWHIDKNIEALKISLRKIEDVINVIKIQGKIAYINSSEDAYRRIYHDYSDFVDGFVKWKGELENVLT